MVNSNSQAVLKTNTGLYLRLEKKKNKQGLELVAAEVQNEHVNAPRVYIWQQTAKAPSVPTGEQAQTGDKQKIWMALCFPHDRNYYLLKVDGETMTFEHVADPTPKDLGDDYLFQADLKSGEHYTLRTKVSQQYIGLQSAKKAHLSVTMSSNPVYVTHLNDAE